jgi:hypothetical protein
MSLLATSFATLQTIERGITHNYADHVRAKLAAQSGVEAATARLSDLSSQGWYPEWSSPGPVHRSWKYFGAERDEARELDLQRSAAEFSKLQEPLDLAANPSFAVEADQDPSNSDSSPASLRIEGREVGYSGSIGGTYQADGDIYTLKIHDCQSQINVNDGAAWGNGHSVSQNLRRILNLLGAQPEVSVSGLGDRTIAARPPGGYRSKQELRRALGEDPFRRAADLLTIWSWTNPYVCNPVPLSEEEYRPEVYPIHPDNPRLVGNGYARPADPAGRRIFRYGHGKDIYGRDILQPLRFWDAALEPGGEDRRYSTPSTLYNAVWTRDSLNPQWIEIVARSPVNVNHASRPVLMALVTGLEGFFEVARRRPVPFDMFYEFCWHYYDYSPDSLSGRFTGSDHYIQNRDDWGTGSSWQSRGSETGFLYRTAPLVGTGETVASGGISAERIVDEILACRDRRPSPAVSSVDYSAEPFGGPFRSWQQFNEFIDHLVRCGLVLDSRPIFYEYAPKYQVEAALVTKDRNFPQVKPWTVVDVTLVDSPVQRRTASQAAADVLKANFNPNLHLNELNPDRVLFTHVDKTDLLLNSTEFCFTPMGRFEIESLGTVLAPTAAEGTTLPAAGGSRIVARNRVHAVVELYAPHHETTQAQFYRGEFGRRQSLPATNNNRAVECGPEPDSGIAPVDCAWDGTISLPTIGGAVADPAWSKPRGELRTGYSLNDRYPGATPTPMGSPAEGLGASIHSHFQYDHCAHHHDGGAASCLPVGRWPNPAERGSVNHNKKSEPRVQGPYSPVDSVFEAPTSGRYRLCRSFSTPMGTATAAAPPRFTYAPSDLRLDGAYVELHSAFGYDLGPVRATKSFTASFWIKPNWFPENTGRIREFISMSNTEEYFRLPAKVRHAAAPADYRWRFPRPLPFGTLYSLPCYFSHESPWTPQYLQPPRIGSFVWALAADSFSTPSPGGYASITPTLTHEFEPYFNSAAAEDFDRFHSSSHAKRFNHFRGHEWVHVTVSATVGTSASRYVQATTDGTTPWWSYSKPGRMSILINGRELPGTDQLTVHLTDLWPTFDFAAQGRSIRVGGEYSGASQPYRYPNAQWYTVTYAKSDGNSTTRVDGAPAGVYSPYRQYFADATIDEFYYWRNQPDAVAAAQGMFRRGRYYRPADDAEFTSREIMLDPPRPLAPGNPISAGTSLETILPAPLEGPSRYLTAVQWTALAEEIARHQDAGGAWRIRPVTNDYRNLATTGILAPMSAPPGPDANGFSYETVAQMFVIVQGPRGERIYGPYHNETFSPIRSEHELNRNSPGKVAVAPDERVRYRVKLRPGAPAVNTCLLATPVVDDVTLFFEHSVARFIHYAEIVGAQ